MVQPWRAFLLPNNHTDARGNTLPATSGVWLRNACAGPNRKSLASDDDPRRQSPMNRKRAISAARAETAPTSRAPSIGVGSPSLIS